MVRRRKSRRPPKSTHKWKPRQFKAVCNACGAEHMVPIAPPLDKQLMCLDCLQAAKEPYLGNG